MLKFQVSRTRSWEFVCRVRHPYSIHELVPLSSTQGPPTESCNIIWRHLRQKRNIYNIIPLQIKTRDFNLNIQFSKTGWNVKIQFPIKKLQFLSFFFTLPVLLPYNMHHSWKQRLTNDLKTSLTSKSVDKLSRGNDSAEDVDGVGRIFGPVSTCCNRSFKRGFLIKNFSMFRGHRNITKQT